MEAGDAFSEHVDLREHMVRSQVLCRGVADPAVIAALRRVPRHRFAPQLRPKQAYADGAFPLRAGQTISQPYIVARMSELLAVEPGMRVLEVGTGSGYQAAVLLELSADLVTVERIPALARAAEDVLRELYPEHPWLLKQGDGRLGYPGRAPYDRVIVTAGSAQLPAPLVQQLAEGGRVVAPLGPIGYQHVVVMTRQADHVDTHTDVACRFVPLVRG